MRSVQFLKIAIVFALFGLWFQYSHSFMPTMISYYITEPTIISETTAEPLIYTDTIHSRKLLPVNDFDDEEPSFIYDGGPVNISHFACDPVQISIFRPIEFKKKADDGAQLYDQEKVDQRIKLKAPITISQCNHAPVHISNFRIEPYQKNVQEDDLAETIEPKAVLRAPLVISVLNAHEQPMCDITHREKIRGQRNWHVQKYLQTAANKVQLAWHTIQHYGVGGMETLIAISHQGYAVIYNHISVFMHSIGHIITNMYHVLQEMVTHFMMTYRIRAVMRLGMQWNSAIIKYIIGVPRTLYANVASSYGSRQATPTKISTLVPKYHIAAKRKSLPLSAIEQMVVQPQPKMASAIFEIQSNLEKLLVQLKWRPDFGETGLQYVLNLLNVELFITECLLKGDNSFMLQEAVTKRIKLVEQSSPSVVHMYNMILNFATTTDAYEMCEHHTQDKKMFLWNVKSKLEFYYSKIQEMQYDLSVVLAG